MDSSVSVTTLLKLKPNCMKIYYCSMCLLQSLSLLLYQLWTGNPYWRRRISMINFPVLTSSDQLLLIMSLFHPYFTKQPILMRRSTVLSHPLQQGFLGFDAYMIRYRDVLFNVIWCQVLWVDIFETFRQNEI